MNKTFKKSERAEPHPIGRKGLSVPNPKSQILTPNPQIQGTRFQVKNLKKFGRKKIRVKNCLA